MHSIASTHTASRPHPLDKGKSTSFSVIDATDASDVDAIPNIQLLALTFHLAILLIS